MNVLTKDGLLYFWNKVKAALNQKQDKITVSGLLKGNGSAVSAAVPDIDYATTDYVSRAIAAIVDYEGVSF